MTIEYTKSTIDDISKLYGSDLKNNTLLLFVGHAHSGHSILGSILDCHKKIVLANEVNIAKTISEYRLTKHQIESILMHESQRPNNSKWLNSAYHYDTKHGFQSDLSTPPQVIGDKKAGGTTRILKKHPWVLEYLLSLFGKNLKFIFVKRNPIDVVAAYSHYMKQPICQFHVDRYIENYETSMKIKSLVSKNQFFTVDQGVFIHNPISQTKNILSFLNLEKAHKQEELATWCSIVRNDIQGKSQIIDVPEKLIRQLKNYI